MTTPGQQPPNPTNPNVLQNPANIHVVPEINHVLSDEQWGQQYVTIEDALHATQKAYERVRGQEAQMVKEYMDRGTFTDEAAALNFYRSDPKNPARAHIDNQRQDYTSKQRLFENTCRQIIGDSNPDLVLGYLRARSEGHTKEEANARSRAQAATAKQADTRNASNQARLAHRNQLIDAATEDFSHITDPKERKKLLANQKYETDQASRVSGLRTIEAVTAGMHNTQAQNTAAKRAGRETIAGQVFNTLSTERNAIIRSAESYAYNADQTIYQYAPIVARNNDPTMSSGPNNIDVVVVEHVRDVLNDLGQELDQLSPYDPQRARLLEAHNALLYRLKQRQITTAANQGAPIDSKLEADGGITINVGQGDDEKVIYDNGDELVVRQDAQGKWQNVRMQTEGHERPAAETAPIPRVSPRNETRTDFPSQELTTWDVNRTPEATARAFAEIEAYSTFFENEENRLEQAVDKHIQAIDKNDHDIQYYRDLAQQLQDWLKNAPADDPRIDDARTRVVETQRLYAQAVNAQPALEQAYIADRRQLSEARDRLAPALYWRDLLGNRMEPLTDEQRKARHAGRVGLRKNVKQQESTPYTTELQSNGTVIRTNYRAHDNNRTDWLQSFQNRHNQTANPRWRNSWRREWSRSEPDTWYAAPDGREY